MRRIPISCSIIVVLIVFSFAGCGGYSSTGSVNGGGPGGPYSGVDVLTYHYDNQRAGQNLNETALTPANVNSTKFGKLGEFPVDGRVDAQPLYLSQVTIGGQKKNVLYVATEHGSVYAIDADSVNALTASFLWKTSTLGNSETPSDPVEDVPRFRRKLASPRRRSLTACAMPSTSWLCRRTPLETISSVCMRST